MSSSILLSFLLLAVLCTFGRAQPILCKNPFNLASPSLNIFQSLTRCMLHPSSNHDTYTAPASPLQPTLGLIFDITAVPMLLRDLFIFASAGWEATKYYQPNALANDIFGPAVNASLAANRRPASERLPININTAVAYTVLRVGDARLPWDRSFHHTIFSTLFGLDPNDFSTDMTSPVGIGNFVGSAIVNYMYNDGLNQLGELDCNRYGKAHGKKPVPYHRSENRFNFSDYTCYKPKNTDSELSDPNAWQPMREYLDRSTWYSQEFANANMIHAPSYAPHNFEELQTCCRGPYKSPHAPYYQQAAELVGFSANLTPEQKMVAEFFNNKTTSISDVIVHFITQEVAAGRVTPSPILVMKVAASTTASYYDAVVFSWKLKYKYDAIRPFSAVKYLFEDDTILAWSKNRGTKPMKGVSWEPYLPTGPFPEYVSTTTCITYAFMRMITLLRGNTTAGWDLTLNFPAGSSLIEPGITPPVDTSVTFSTTEDHALQASLSRMWGGVHFRKASEDPRKACAKVADEVFAKWVYEMNGDPLLNAA